MNRGEAVDLIKKKIRVQFDTKMDAAMHLNMSVQHLSRILDHGHSIPDRVLEFAGIQRVVTETYTKTRAQK